MVEAIKELAAAQREHSQVLANANNLEIRQAQRDLEMEIKNVQTDEQRLLLAKRLSNIERGIN